MGIMVSQKKIDGSKFSGFPEKCFFFPEKFSDQRIYVYRIKPRIQGLAFIYIILK